MGVIMSRKNNYDLTNILKPFIGKNLWVALNSSQTKVLASSKNISEVIKKAKLLSDEKPVLMKTKQDYISYAPDII
jgi:hypothetical protein